MAESRKKWRLRIAVFLVFIAGSIPFLVGLSILVFTWISYFYPDEPFRAVLPPGGQAPFTLNEVRSFNDMLGIELITSKHVHYSILTAVGILIMTLAQFGLRKKLRWSWYVLVVTILLVGWNDAITSFVFGFVPVPIIPATLATIGLYLARKPLFQSEIDD